MSNFLDRAGEAVQQRNWPLVHQYLEQLLEDAYGQNALSLPAQAVETAEERSLALALQVLYWGDFQARWDVAKLFPSFGPAAIAPLIALLQEDEADLESRWFAIRILSEFHDPAVLRVLIDLLQDSEAEDLSEMAADAIANLGTSGIADLTELLNQDGTRLLAVQTLAQIHQSETIEPLLTVVNDPQPTVRVLAIEGLSSFHDPRVLNALIPALTDSVPMVRKAAIAGLGVRASLSASPDLVNYFADRLWDVDLGVCQQAAIALGRLGTDAAAAALFRGLNDPTPAIPLQLEMIRALGWIGSEMALDYLKCGFSLQHLIGEPTIVQEMMTVLGRWADPVLKLPASQILITFLKSNAETTQQPSVRQAIALALGQLGQYEAMDTLIHLLADEDSGVQLHAIAALKTLDARLAHEQLKVLATQDHVSAPLRQGVTIALQEWNR